LAAGQADLRSVDCHQVDRLEQLLYEVAVVRGPRGLRAHDAVAIAAFGDEESVELRGPPIEDAHVASPGVDADDVSRGEVLEFGRKGNDESPRVDTCPPPVACSVTDEDRAKARGLHGDRPPVRDQERLVS